MADYNQALGNPSDYDGTGARRLAPDDPGTGVMPAAPKANKGVATEHPAYCRMKDKWRRCRDVSQGGDAVHSAGESYLPRLSEQTPEEYESYVLRATFYNATWRTIDGLRGMLFRKPPMIEASEDVKLLLEDVTMAGSAFTVFAQTIAEEAIKMGRVGVLVDYPQANVAGLTQADAAPLNLRPTMCLYLAESIINWKRRKIANRSVLSMVVLTEEFSTPDGEFAETTGTQYRVLDLDPAKRADGSSNNYRQRVYRLNDKGDAVQQGADVYPTMAGKMLDYIPFQFFGTDDTTPEVDDPPMIDLVDMNLAHYRVTADYENGCHFTGLPTPYIAGYVKEAPGEKLYIGSQSAWVFPNPQTKCGYLEYTGTGLKALESNLDRKEQQMAVLGARMLEALKRGIESAETASIHRVGEESVLANIAQVVSIGLTRTLGWFSQWAGSQAKASVDLNRDFYPVPMTAEMLTALVAGWQQRAYPYETLVDNLKQGQIVAADATAESLQQQIDEQPPQLLVPPGTVAPNQPANDPKQPTEQPQAA